MTATGHGVVLALGVRSYSSIRQRPRVLREGVRMLIFMILAIVQGCCHNSHDSPQDMDSESESDLTIIHVVYAFDNDLGFQSGFLASVLSLLSNTRTPEFVAIHVLLSEPEDSGIDRSFEGHSIVSLVDKMGATIKFHRYNASRVDLFKNARLLSHATKPRRGVRLLSSSNHVRFILADILASVGVDECLWLDADTIIQGDVVPFVRNVDLGEYPLAAFVEWNAMMMTDEMQQIHAELIVQSKMLRQHGLTIAPKQPEFEAGVVIFNLRIWRSHRLTNKVSRLIHLLNTHIRASHHWGSQPPLLLLFGGDKFLPLDPNLIMNDLGGQSNSIVGSQLILHWTGPRKPWLPDGLFRDHWLPYSYDNFVLTEASSQGKASTGRFATIAMMESQTVSNLSQHHDKTYATHSPLPSGHDSNKKRSSPYVTRGLENGHKEPAIDGSVLNTNLNLKVKPDLEANHDASDPDISSESLLRAREGPSQGEGDNKLKVPMPEQQGEQKQLITNFDSRLHTARAYLALRRAIRFFRHTVSVGPGGFVWSCIADLSECEGELSTDTWQIWIEKATPLVGEAFIDCFLQTKSRECFAGACEVAAVLEKGQLNSGGWAHMVDLHPKRRATTWSYRVDGPWPFDRDEQGRKLTRIWEGDRSSLDDGNTQSVLHFLLRFYALNQDSSYTSCDVDTHTMISIGLRSILEWQFASGAWPQYYPFEQAWELEHHDNRHAGYRTDRDYARTRNHEILYTVNDNIMMHIVRVFALAHELFGNSDASDGRYLESIRRAGDFLIRAQLPYPQNGWAQQYDFDMKPAWGRIFEPPAVASRESENVILTLLDIYIATRDEKYLSPIPAAIMYLRSSLLPSGRLARFYELETNRPLYFTKEYTLTYDYSPNDIPTHYDFVVDSNIDEIERRYQMVKESASGDSDSEITAHHDDVPQLEQQQRRNVDWHCRTSKRPSSREEIDDIMRDMDDRGAWVESGGLRRSARAKPKAHPLGVIKSQTFVNNLRQLALYIHCNLATNTSSCAEDSKEPEMSTADRVVTGTSQAATVAASATGSDTHDTNGQVASTPYRPTLGPSQSGWIDRIVSLTTNRSKDSEAADYHDDERMSESTHGAQSSSESMPEASGQDDDSEAASRSKQLHVVYSVDRKFIVALEASMRSMIVNTLSPQALVVHLIVNAGTNADSMIKSSSGNHRDELQLTFLDDLIAFAKEKMVTVVVDKFWVSQLFRFENRRVAGRNKRLRSHSNYVRFILADILVGVDQCLWLDADTIIQGDVVQYFRSIGDLGEFPLAAFPEWDRMMRLPQMMDIWHRLQDLVQQGVLKVEVTPKGQPEFNAGIILYNLRVWRQRSLAKDLEQLIDVLNSEVAVPHAHGFGSQPPLLFMFAGHGFKQLPRRIRPFSTMTNDLGFKEGVPVSSKSLFLHWNGSRKPWNSDGLYREYWLRYAQDAS